MKQLCLPLAVMLLFSCRHLSSGDQASGAMATSLNNAKAPMLLPDVPDTLLQSGRRNIYLFGRRNMRGFFVERSIYPVGYKGMPHVHSGDIYVTVISGSVHLAFGKVFDTTVVADAYGPGSFVIIPADKPHYEWFGESCTIQVEGQGPQETFYVTDSSQAK